MRGELGLHLGTFGLSGGDVRRVALGSLATVVVGSLAAGALSGKILELVPYALAFGLAAGLATALLLVLLGSTLRVQVFELGLRAPGFVPPPVAMRWAEIAAVDTFANASGEYLRLHRVGGGRCAYLPIGLGRQSEFCSLVIGRAGASHPLALVLAAAA